MKGMTGFSYISKITEYGKINVYLKSLNSRFFELRMIVSPFLQKLEPTFREMIKKDFKRGKIELIVEFLPKGTSFEMVVDEELAKSYFLSLKKLSNYLGLLPDIEIVDIANMPNVINLVKPELPNSFLRNIQNIVKRAIEDVLKQRTKEGEETKRDIEEIISKIKQDISLIVSRWNEVNFSIEEKVKERVEKFLKEYENRKEVDTSLISFLMKIDINEEMFRFSKHLESLEVLLDTEGEIGKKIEFLLQELGREINTVASKSFDYFISSKVVEIKTSLEKIKEHIQNIE